MTRPHTNLHVGQVAHAVLRLLAQTKYQSRPHDLPELLRSFQRGNINASHDDLLGSSGLVSFDLNLVSQARPKMDILRGGVHFGKNLSIGDLYLTISENEFPKAALVNLHDRARCGDLTVGDVLYASMPDLSRVKLSLVNDPQSRPEIISANLILMLEQRETPIETVIQELRAMHHETG